MQSKDRQENPINTHKVMWAIAIKDMCSLGANIQVWLPMLILPVIFGVVLPAVFLLVLRSGGAETAFQDLNLAALLDQLSFLDSRLSTFQTLEQQGAYFVLNYFFASFFLLIPLMTASVTSADSFAGEKERGTLETLLFSPAPVKTILIGKVMACFIPAMALTLLTLALTTVVANILGWPLFHQLFFPNINWLPLVFLVIPALSFSAILLNVFMSAKVATFQAAYQIGGVVVLPAILLIVGQISGVLLLSLPVIFVIGMVLVVLDIALLTVLRRHLDRSRLFESQIR